MSSDDSVNLNRAVSNAAGDAEKIERDVMVSLSDPNMMQGIFLDNYVKSLTDIKPEVIPRPTFESFITNLGQTRRAIPSEPLLHVKITHTAINHVDLLYAHGNHQNNKSGLVKPPFTLGLEFSGIVLAIHNPKRQNCSFRPGDKVWGGSIGTHTEDLILPASAAHHLPDPSWSLHDIAALGAGTFPVSFGALTFIANVKAGEIVLVHAAAGGLGVYAVQIAKALGAKVVGTVGSQHKMAVVEDLIRDPGTGQLGKGEGVINYGKDGWENDVIALCKQNDKDGVDVVYDTVGLVQKSIRCTTFNGRIVVAGFAGRTGTGAKAVNELEKLDVNRVLLKQIKLLGYRFGETSRRFPHEAVKIWAGLNEMLAQNPRVIRPVIYKTYRGLEYVTEALHALNERKVYGKAVIEVCSEKEAKREASQKINSGLSNILARL